MNTRTSYREERNETYAEVYAKTMVSVVLALTSILAIACFMVAFMM